MPRKPRHPCNRPGCRALTDTRFCPEHTTQHKKETSWRTSKGSSSARGYGAAWQRLRKMILARDPLCRVCDRAASTCVDHIVNKAAGGDDTMENLQGLCDGCHTIKTQREAAAAKGQ